MNPSGPDNPYGLQRPPAPGPAPTYPPPPPIPPQYAQPPMAVAPAPVLPIDPRAKTAALILFGCAGLMLLSCGTYSWFTGHGGRELGIIGIQRCHGGCESANWLDFKQAPSELRMFAVMGFLGAVAAIGMLVHSGVVLLKGAAERVKQRAVNGCLAIAVFGMLSFVIELTFGAGSSVMSIGWGSFVGLGSVVAASVILAAWVRPMARARLAHTAAVPVG